MITSCVVTSDSGKNVRGLFTLVLQGNNLLLVVFQLVREVKFKHAPDVVVTETVEAHESTIVRPK
jgi:hypothetical protein